ncbi:MAG: cupin domain-containing protein [Opitutales bacterium]|nr:cupin domain-containing protein [Opitutales bacterium]
MDSVDVYRCSEDAEYFFREGCHIFEWLNRPEDPDVSVARARVAPGVRTRRHRLTGIAERYLVLEGRGEVEIGDRPPAAISPGSVVLIPPGCDQCVTNTGEGALVFLAVCTPRFLPEAYIDSEEPGP